VEIKMFKRIALGIIVGVLSISALAQGPCASQSGKLACVIPQEYGVNAFDFTNVLRPVGDHPEHFNRGSGDIQSRLQPLTKIIGRQANLLPLASPSSGVLLTFDSSLKTQVITTDSLGPVLGERAETVGRHRLFLGFSYQFFDFDRIDGVDLRNIPAVLVHQDDSDDNVPKVCSAATTSLANVNGCAFVRDAVKTNNSIDLKASQYTAYVTFGLTSRIDVSLVIPFENVRFGLRSNDTIVLGTDGNYPVVAGTQDALANSAPRFDHLFRDCPNYPGATSAAALDPRCLNHSFPDPGLTGGGSNANNSATGIGDLVARVKWNAWHGERANFAAGVDVRLPSGDALNFLGSGSYGAKPFAVFSYRARISPHVLVGYEWNSDSITAGDLVENSKGSVPNDFVYSAGADAWVTKWLTGSFDIIGQRFFDTSTLAVVPQTFLAPCGSCAVVGTARPTPDTVTYSSVTEKNQSYNLTNASMGIKLRPFPKVSKLVITANVLVRLDEGGLHSKPAPLIGLGYTF
jgi:Putative MetA-pathway of phenol degradation